MHYYPLAVCFQFILTYGLNYLIKPNTGDMYYDSIVSDLKIFVSNINHLFCINKLN